MNEFDPTMNDALEQDMADYTAGWESFMDEVDATRLPAEPVIVELAGILPPKDGITLDPGKNRFYAELRPPKHYAADEFDGLLYYAMQSLGLPVALTDSHTQVELPDGSTRVVHWQHLFGVQADSNIERLAEACRNEATGFTFALRALTTTPRDIEEAGHVLQNAELSPDEASAERQRFLQSIVMTAVIRYEDYHLTHNSALSGSATDRERRQYHATSYKNHELYTRLKLLGGKPIWQDGMVRLMESLVSAKLADIAKRQ